MSINGAATPLLCHSISPSKDDVMVTSSNRIANRLDALEQQNERYSYYDQIYTINSQSITAIRNSHNLIMKNTVIDKPKELSKLVCLVENIKLKKPSLGQRLERTLFDVV